MSRLTGRWEEAPASSALLGQAGFGPSARATVALRPCSRPLQNGMAGMARPGVYICSILEEVVWCFVMQLKSNTTTTNTAEIGLHDR